SHGFRSDRQEGSLRWKIRTGARMHMPPAHRIELVLRAKQAPGLSPVAAMRQQRVVETVPPGTSEEAIGKQRLHFTAWHDRHQQDVIERPALRVEPESPLAFGRQHGQSLLAVAVIDPVMGIEDVLPHPLQTGSGTERLTR